MASASIVGGELYRDRVLRDGAVGYWRLGEPSGTVVVDLAPTPHNGAYSATGVTLGQPGAIADGDAAALFNGSSGKATVATFNPLSGLAACTLEAWVNHNGAAWMATHEMVQCWAAIGMYLSVNNTYVFGSLRILGVQQLTVTVTMAVPVSGWHHLALVWISGDKLRCYLDGVQAGTSVAAASGTLDSCAGLTIGAFGSANWFTGSLDDIAVYPTALTAQQIAEHYGLRLAVASGLRIGGAAPTRRGRAQVGTGGLQVGGAAPTTRGRAHVGTGGVQVGGAAPHAFTQRIGAQQETGQIVVNLDSWVATVDPSAADWLSIVSGVSGVAGDAVSWAADTNPSAARRSGVLTIGGVPYTIAQIVGSRRRLILEAIQARLEAITQANGFDTDAGQAIYLGGLPVLGPDDPDVAIAIIPGEDTIRYQGVNILLQLPVTLAAVAKADLATPHLAAEAVLGDIKRAIELEDRTLGGLVKRQIERNTTRVLPRHDGSSVVGVAIQYTAPYQEGWGAP